MDASADFHVLIGIVIHGQPAALKADLAGLALEQDQLFRVFQYPTVIFNPGFPVARHGHFHGSHADVLGEFQGFQYGFFSQFGSCGSVILFIHVFILLWQK